MINRPELLALEFYKLRPFKGSDKGIRYMIQKDTVEIPPKQRNRREIPQRRASLRRRQF